MCAVEKIDIVKDEINRFLDIEDVNNNEDDEDEDGGRSRDVVEKFAALDSLNLFSYYSNEVLCFRVTRVSNQRWFVTRQTH